MGEVADAGLFTDGKDSRVVPGDGWQNTKTGRSRCRWESGQRSNTARVSLPSKVKSVRKLVL